MKKTGKLRAIDRGTIYDVEGSLRKRIRGLRDGEDGDVTDAVLLLRNRDGKVTSFHFGPGGRERAHFMVSTAKNRLEPA